MPTRYLLYPVRAAGEFLRRRRAVREPAFLDAAVVSAPGFGSINCAVRDFSTDGARLEIERPPRKPVVGIALPSEVRIYFGRKETEVRARIMWRDGSHFGVAFLGRPQTTRKAS